jgi:hypothetical protein
LTAESTFATLRGVGSRIDARVRSALDTDRNTMKTRLLNRVPHNAAATVPAVLRDFDYSLLRFTPESL